MTVMKESTLTRVKMCGITRPQDARIAAHLGADAIGLVFYEPSPRHVSIAQAQAIVRELPPFLTVVGLFVNADPQRVSTTLEQVALDRLQFHGDESPEYCNQFNKPYIKALRVRASVDIQHFVRNYPRAQAILLDTYIPGTPGGTGITFDWQQIPVMSQFLIIAGGLTPDNVAQAITTLRPYAVDISGGIESAKGIKDVNKMTAFMQAVKNASV